MRVMRWRRILPISVMPTRQISATWFKTAATIDSAIDVTEYVEAMFQQAFTESGVATGRPRLKRG